MTETDDSVARTRDSLLNKLLIPVLVGTIVALGAYLIPKLLEAGKRVSYTADKTTNYLSGTLENVTIQVNGVTTSNLYVSKVRLWNSGSVSLTDLGVLIVFDAPDRSFKILNVAHSTKPDREFGGITETRPDDKSVRVVYSLLNRQDEDTISFLTNEPAESRVFAKAADLRVLKVDPDTTNIFGFSTTAGLIGIVSAGLAAALGNIMAHVVKRHQTKKMEAAQKAEAAADLRD